MSYKFHDIFYDQTNNRYGIDTTDPSSLFQLGEVASITTGATTLEANIFSVFKEETVGDLDSLLVRFDSQKSDEGSHVGFSLNTVNTSSATISQLNGQLTLTQYSGSAGATNLAGNISYVIFESSTGANVDTLYAFQSAIAIDIGGNTGATFTDVYGNYTQIYIRSDGSNIYGYSTYIQNFSSSNNVIQNIYGFTFDINSPFIEVDNVYGFYCVPQDLASDSGAITNQFTGIYIDTTNVNAIETFAIISVNQTANSYLAGKLGIGVADFDAKLEILQEDLGSSGFYLSSVSTDDYPDFSIEQNKVYTTDDTTTTIHSIQLLDSTIYLIEARIVARRTGGIAGSTNDGAAYKISGAFKGLTSLTSGQIGSTCVDCIFEDQAGWNADFSLSGSTLNIDVTGAIDNDISWVITVFIQKISE